MPLLATSWEQVDDSHLRVKLREGVKFHSGAPLNADTVRQSFERFAKPGVPGQGLRPAADGQGRPEGQ